MLFRHNKYHFLGPVGAEKYKK